jgi:hypothetical protein
MPATKEKPNLRLVHNFPDLAGGQSSGAVVPAWAVPDPDALVSLGAAEWTGEPVTVQMAPPSAAMSNAVTASPEVLADLAAARKHAEEVAEAKLKVEDEAAELRKSLAKANADIAAKEAAERELAELKAAVAKAASLKDAKEAAK